MGTYQYKKSDDSLTLISGRQPDNVYRYSDALSLEEIEASTSLSGKIPSAQAVKDLASVKYKDVTISTNNSDYKADISQFLTSDMEVIGVKSLVGTARYTLLDGNYVTICAPYWNGSYAVLQSLKVSIPLRIYYYEK